VQSAERNESGRLNLASTCGFPAWSRRRLRSALARETSARQDDPTVPRTATPKRSHHHTRRFRGVAVARPSSRSDEDHLNHLALAIRPTSLRNTSGLSPEVLAGGVHDLTPSLRGRASQRWGR
jgi:hypothetical protein